MQAGELMQDYKTGHLIEASPRGQFLGQLVGSTAGIFASTFAYKVRLVASVGRCFTLTSPATSSMNGHTSCLGPRCPLPPPVSGSTLPG